jgi:hypothetical protein
MVKQAIKQKACKAIECELNEEVRPDQGISFLQGSPNHTHGTRVVIALNIRLLLNGLGPQKSHVESSD